MVTLPITSPVALGGQTNGHGHDVFVNLGPLLYLWNGWSFKFGVQIGIEKF